MAELKTPLRYKFGDCWRGDGLIPFKTHYVLDATGEILCDLALQEEAEQIISAVNRDAEHAETVRTLREQRDALLAALRGVVRQTHDDGPCWCSLPFVIECTHEVACIAASAAVAAAEGGGA